MAYLTEAQVRSKINTTSLTIAELILAIDSATNALKESFDIFMSHSIKDAVIVLGLKRMIEAAGKTVYVDWISDSSLDRDKVSGETAEKLRRRMKLCGSLLYVYSAHSRQSRWMPWELGYFDGFNGNVAILPILPDNGTLDFENEEYLQIYPKVDFLNISTEPSIYINKSRHFEPSVFKKFDEWRSGSDKLRPEF